MNGQTASASRIDLRAFLENPGVVRLLDQDWDERGFYRDQATGEAAAITIQQHILAYHCYLSLLGGETRHAQRANALAAVVAHAVGENGFINNLDGSVADHPAVACFVTDALGTFCHYGEQFGAAKEIRDAARAAILRVVHNHPQVRLPDGVMGKTQQLRFELRAWYWAWRVTGDEAYRRACLRLWENGLYSYRNIAVYSRPSLYPDYTWNYACNAGEAEYAGNTHTPAYYCAEAEGLLFVYMHGLKDGVFPETPAANEFCRDYMIGLFRNLSRAGHTASDVDGYGVHRAWFGGCLVETVPVEAVGAALRVGLAPETRGWFRWYVDQYVDFVRRSPTYAENGIQLQFPYGHHITVESQFPGLLGIRFYTYLARGLFEYGLEKIAPVEPPAFCMYAWWHKWVRVSTPKYETSLVGATSLSYAPFDSRALGCLHGGSPLATLFSGNQLLYATSNDPAGLWHVELTDLNGATFRSCCTSFHDEATMSVKTSDGKLLTRDSFRDHETPHHGRITDSPTEVAWSKNLSREKLRFFVQNAYRPEGFSSEWGFGCPVGNYIREAVFVLPVPATLQPEARVEGVWKPLGLSDKGDTWPEALRWRNGESCVTVSIKPLQVEHPGGFRHRSDGIPGFEALPPVRSIKGFEVRAVETKERSPGGKNSFCPFPVLQVRLYVNIGLATRAGVICDFTFTD